MTERPLAGDWEAIDSSSYGVSQPGATRIVFLDPQNPERCLSREFLLDGLVLQDLERLLDSSPLSLKEVEGLASMEQEAPGKLGAWHEDVSHHLDDL